MAAIETWQETTVYTDMALLVQLVVGQFQFVEVDDNRSPVGAQGRGVRVDVQTSRGTLFLETADPACVVLVAVLVDWCHVHQQYVGHIWLQVIELHLDGWEHPPIIVGGGNGEMGRGNEEGRRKRRSQRLLGAQCLAQEWFLHFREACHSRKIHKHIHNMHTAQKGSIRVSGMKSIPRSVWRTTNAK